ncbi:Leucine-rich repeats, outliers, partial [Dimargaris xerosporica]
CRCRSPTSLCMPSACSHRLDTMLQATDTGPFDPDAFFAAIENGNPLHKLPESPSLVRQVSERPAPTPRWPSPSTTSSSVSDNPQSVVAYPTHDCPPTHVEAWKRAADGPQARDIFAPLYLEQIFAGQPPPPQPSTAESLPLDAKGSMPPSSPPQRPKAHLGLAANGSPKPRDAGSDSGSSQPTSTATTAPKDTVHADPGSTPVTPFPPPAATTTASTNQFPLFDVQQLFQSRCNSTTQRNLLNFIDNLDPAHSTTASPPFLTSADATRFSTPRRVAFGNPPTTSVHRYPTQLSSSSWPSDPSDPSATSPATPHVLAQPGVSALVKHFKGPANPPVSAKVSSSRQPSESPSTTRSKIATIHQPSTASFPSNIDQLSSVNNSKFLSSTGSILPPKPDTSHRVNTQKNDHRQPGRPRHQSDPSPGSTGGYPPLTPYPVLPPSPTAGSRDILPRSRPHSQPLEDYPNRPSLATSREAVGVHALHRAAAPHDEGILRSHLRPAEPSSSPLSSLKSTTTNAVRLSPKPMDPSSPPAVVAVAAAVTPTAITPAMHMITPRQLGQALPNRVGDMWFDQQNYRWVKVKRSGRAQENPRHPRPHLPTSDASAVAAQVSPPSLVGSEYGTPGSANDSFPSLRRPDAPLSLPLSSNLLTPTPQEPPPLSVSSSNGGSPDPFQGIDDLHTSDEDSHLCLNPRPPTHPLARQLSVQSEDDEDAKTALDSQYHHSPTPSRTSQHARGSQPPSPKAPNVTVPLAYDHDSLHVEYNSVSYSQHQQPSLRSSQDNPHNVPRARAPEVASLTRHVLSVNSQLHRWRITPMQSPQQRTPGSAVAVPTSDSNQRPPARNLSIARQGTHQEAVPTATSSADVKNPAVIFPSVFVVPSGTHWDLSHRGLTSLQAAKPYTATVEELDASDNLLETVDVPLPNLCQLNLANNRLQYLAPDTALRWTHLEVLDLSGNGLGSLDHLSGLRHLRQLTADRNAITSLAGLQHLPRLEVLSVAKNQLTMLDLHPNQMPRLQRLSAAHNTIARLDRVVDQLPALRFLDLDGNRLRCIHLDQPMLTLRTLRVSDNPWLGCYPLAATPRPNCSPQSPSALGLPAPVSHRCQWKCCAFAWSFWFPHLRTLYADNTGVATLANPQATTVSCPLNPAHNGGIDANITGHANRGSDGLDYSPVTPTSVETKPAITVPSTRCGSSWRHLQNLSLRHQPTACANNPFPQTLASVHLDWTFVPRIANLYLAGRDCQHLFTAPLWHAQPKPPNHTKDVLLPYLVQLELQHCELTQPPSAFKVRLPSLRRLDLRGNPALGPLATITATTASSRSASKAMPTTTPRQPEVPAPPSSRTPSSRRAGRRYDREKGTISARGDTRHRSRTNHPLDIHSSSHLQLLV